MSSLALHPTIARSDVNQDVQQLSWVERGLILVGIAEIPLQLDKYFMFHERDADLGAVGGFNVSLTTVALVGLYWIWITQAALQQRPRFDRFRLGLPMLLYILAVVLSLLSSTVALLAMFDIFLLVQAYLLFFYLANRIRSRDDLLYCFGCLAATILIQSVIIMGLAAAGDFAVGREFNIGPLVLSVWDDGRPAGSMQSAVLAGSTLAILWLPCVAISFVQAPKPIALGCGSALVFGLLAIILTQTRGAILSSVFGVVLLSAGLGWRNWLPRWVIPAALVLSMLMAYPLFIVVKSRLQGGDSGSAKSRLHLSSIAMEMIQARPLLGYGAGNCHLAGQDFADQAKYRAEWYYTIHCKYLLVWIETGLVGLVCFLAVLGNGIRQAVATWFLGDRLFSPLGLALAVALLGHMLHMVVDVFNSRTQVQVLWVILGLAAAVYRLSRQGANDTARTWSVGYAQ